MAENEIEVGYSQHTAGADGLITSANVVGVPSIVCMQANVFAVSCYLKQNDPSTGFLLKVWRNDGTSAVPSWTLIFTGSGNQNNMTSRGNPTVSDDSSLGFSIGSLWFNTTSNALFVLVDPTPGAAVWDVVNSTGTLVEVQKTISNAQVLALNGTPIQIVAATGVASEAIIPISATMAYTRSVASYATNTELDLIHSGSSNAILKTSIAGAASTFAPFVNAVSPTPSGNVFIANADLNLFVPTGNPTGGDAGSSIIVTVLYKVMTVL